MIDNILFSAVDIKHLKTTENEGQKKLVEELLAEAKGVLENGGQIELLGFGYYYTGDEAYFEKARERMLEKAAEPKWYSDECQGRSELCTGARCTEMAYGFSMFGDKLTDEERSLVVKATYEKGIRPILEDWLLPETKIHAFDTMGHNWWPVCVSHAALALVVMKDETELIVDGEELLKMVCKGLEEWFAYKGNPINVKPASFDNGGFYESINYLDYTLHIYLNFADAYRQIMGSRPFDDIKWLELSACFFANTFYPSDRADYGVAFGDTGTNQMRYAPVWMVRYGVEVPELRWYLQNCTHTLVELLSRTLYYEKIYGTPAEHPKSLSVAYDKIGWAVFRDSFKKNANMLAIKCGDTWNHAHADAAHFILYRKGVPQIYDSMTTNYSDKLYIGYYVESEAHNVLLFEGKGQDVRDNYKNHARMRGQLYNYMDEDGFRYIVADGTGPMSRYFRKHLRHFLWLDGFILIYDDVECYENGEVNFLLHAKEDNPFQMLTPCTVTERDGYAGSSKKEVKYKSFNQMTDNEGHVKFVSVLLLDDKFTPVMTELENAWKITCGDTVVYVNRLSDGKIMHRNCINVMDGIMTDAILLVDKQGRYGVVNGSIVRKDRISYHDTLARTNGWVDIKEKE